MRHPPARVFSLRRVARAALGAWLLAAGVGCGACPKGEQEICNRAGDCRCGASCGTDDGCAGNDICLHYASEPSAAGVCVDVVWATGGPSPCQPLCRGEDVCVPWTETQNVCSRPCTTATECASGCCAPLTNGTKVCAPAAEFCAGVCDPECAGDLTCVAFTPPTCVRTCTDDAECPATCCVGLEGGGGVCAPTLAYCPTEPRSSCDALDACVRVSTQFTAAAAGASCGALGSYEGAAANYCGQAAYCRACWWSPTTQSYSDCAALGRVPSNVTVPLDATRCADTAFPDPPVKLRCTSEASAQSGVDCLGSGPLP